MQRRHFLQLVSNVALMGACNPMVFANSNKTKPKVIVIGGGFGGATAAKYLRWWSQYQIDVTVIEPHSHFISGPLSNLVLSGAKRIQDLTFSYQDLVQKQGVNWITATVTKINPQQQTVQLSTKHILYYDRLILSPGIEFMWEMFPALQTTNAQQQIVHAWYPGLQTTQLQRQIAAIPNGRNFVMTVPMAPYRCPPGPYERACQVAYYFKQHKPNSKVIIVDANSDVVSKGALFKAVWAKEYANQIEYHPNFNMVDIDLAKKIIISDFDDRIQGEVINVIPPQRAAGIAVQTGLNNINQRWCEVDFLSYESTQAKNIHILGDAIQAAQLMPKSGHMANQQAKVCAAAMIDLFADRAPNQNPVVNNTCYSFVSNHEAMHIASVHHYAANKKTMLAINGAGGLSPAPSLLEGEYAWGWAQNIWHDMLG